LTPRLSVVHVTEPVDGGVARCLVDFAADQARRGWDVAVVSPPHPPFCSAVESAGASHLPWNVPRRLAAGRRAGVPGVAQLRGLGRLASTISGARPDVVHLHSSVAGVAGRVAIRGRATTVFQPHCWSFQAVSGPRRSAAEVWERFAARWTTMVVCVSDAERRLGEQAGIGSPFQVVPNGVDVEAVREATENDRASARARLGLASGPLVVCVGGLRRQKGQDVLLDAWPTVRRAFGDASLAFVGSGPDLTLLERRAADGVHFAGERDDALDWLAVADVVALPSRWDGMSLVLLEAMASGRSIVATDVPGVREALGDAGAIVPVESAAALAAALVARLGDHELRAREGRAARRRAETRHDVRATSEALASSYAAALAGAREPRP